MNLSKIIEDANKEFKQNMINFCKSAKFNNLTPEKALFFSNGIKKSLAEAGKSALLNFLESFEESADIITDKNVLMRFKQVSEKRFLTPFGEIILRRRIYQNDKGGDCLIPLDSKWGVDNEYASPDVREAVCFTTAHVTPIEAEKIFSKCSLFRPSSTAIKHIVTKTGVIVEKHKEEINTSIREKESVPIEAKAVAISLDGVNVLLNEPGIKKGRPTQRPKLGNHNNDKTSFRNAMVGSISFYDREKGKPKRINSIYTSQMPEKGFPTFKQSFENEIHHINKSMSKSVQKILIFDGHHSLKGYVTDNPIFKGYHYVIDFYHAMEHLSQASELLFGKSSPKATVWFQKWRKEFLETDNAVDKMVRALHYFSGKLNNEKRKQLLRERKYFLKRKNQMNYAWFVKRALPIGSGPVEAACKSVVKTRLCRSGMRWSRIGGQNILDFRTYVKSNRWEAFWKQCQNWKIAA